MRCGWRSKFRVAVRGAAFDRDGKLAQRFEGGGNHFRNFLSAMRSRKAEELNGPILEGHLSSALCHLGNISYRLGTDQPFSSRTKAFGDDKEAAESFQRFEEHLAANSLPSDGLRYRLGPRLTLNAAKENFGSNKEANALLTREYRAPFVVPEKV